MSLQTLDTPSIFSKPLSKQIAASVQAQANAVLTAGSALDDAEEISFFAAEKVDATKRAHEREIRPEQAPKLLSPAKAIELLGQTQDPEVDEKLRSLVDFLMRADVNAGVQAARAFSDPSAQALALQYAIGVGEQSGADHAALDELREALAELTLTHGQAIRLGLHALPLSRGWCRDAQEVAAFQKTCRDVIPGSRSLATMLSLLIDRYGCAGATESVVRLMLTVGAEISAIRDPVELARLNALTDELSLARIATTALVFCDPVVSDLSSYVDSVDHAVVNSADLARRLLLIAEDVFVSTQRFTVILDHYGCEHPTGRVKALNGIHKILSELPVSIYKDLETRDYTMNAMTMLRHEATKTEEDTLAGRQAQAASPAPGG